jgi:peptidoglycan/xylan/chitin deacetylase (PgdA/CDA1 family)
MNKRVLIVGAAAVGLGVILMLYQFGRFGAAPPARAFQEGATYVSLRFDDGWKSQLNAHKLLKKHGVPGSIYIISSFMGTRGYMDWEDVHAVSDVMEIGGHTRTHSDLRNLPTLADYEAEIGGDYRALTDQGFDVNTFVYPYGNFSPVAIDVIKKYYLCASTQDVGVNGMGANPYLLRDFTIRANNGMADVARMIQPNAWNILTFHDVGEPGPDANPAERNNAISEQFFEDILEYLKANDIQVVTVAEGCEMLRASQVQ